MPKTLKLTKLVKSPEGIAEVVPATLDDSLAPPFRAYTADELRTMLAALEPKGEQAKDADKSLLPPVSERTSAPVQAPAQTHGSFSLNGIPVMASPIKPDIDPRTGAPYIQPGPRPTSLISPPPSRRFDGR